MCVLLRCEALYCDHLSSIRQRLNIIVLGNADKNNIVIIIWWTVKYEQSYDFR